MCLSWRSQRALTEANPLSAHAGAKSSKRKQNSYLAQTDDVEISDVIH
jgi:hypothetical protein